MQNQKTSVTEESNKLKVVYTAKELIALGDVEQKYLMEPILPQRGCAVLAGKPDTGKSQFARQLCIHIASEKDEFLGFNINAIHKKALYLATEDDVDSTKFLINKQFKGLDVEFNDNLRFIFADTLTHAEILNTLKAELTADPVDLVIVDSFGDIFNSNDSNNNMAMRNTVKDFDRIAKTHGCLILFVHHINKKGYSQSPSQEHFQGGSGLVQKVRLAIQLSEGDGDIRYLSVVKGNYCPKTYKSNSRILLFSEENFLFTYAGETIETNQIGNQNRDSIKQDKFKKEKDVMKSIMNEEEYRNSDLVELYCKTFAKSESTAKRAIKELTQMDFFEKLDNGNYKIVQMASNSENKND
jgi:RecA-family ATPase